MYVRLSACLFMCLFVCLWCDNSRMLQHIITKLDPDRDCVSLQKLIIFLGQRSNNKITRLKSRSNFLIAITLLILELEGGSKAPIVGNAFGYWGNLLNFRWHFPWKSCLGPQYLIKFENFEFFNIALVWHQIWKDNHKLSSKKYCWRCWRHPWRHSPASNLAFYIHV